MIPALRKTFFTQPNIVEDTTGLCGLIVLSKSWDVFWFSLRVLVLLIYSSKPVTTKLTLASFLDFDVSLEALLEILCNLRLCRKLSVALTLRYILLSDDAFDSMDSQEGFRSVLTRVGFVMAYKGVEHTRVGYAILELLLSDDPLFPLLLLLEFDLSYRTKGKHNQKLDSNFVELLWSLCCWGLDSKLHTVSVGGIVWMQRRLLLVTLNCSLHGETPNLLSHSVYLRGILQ